MTFPRISVLFLSLAIPTLCSALTPEQRESDIIQLSSVIRAGYGPLHYKKEKVGLNFEALVESYRNQALRPQTNSEFYYSIVRMVAEFQDSHFSAWLPTTQYADLSFSTDLVQGKVLIDQIDRKVLSETTFPFTRGDEILALDGRPVMEIVDEIAHYTGNGYALTSRRKAAMSIPYRATRTLPLPKGSVSVTVRHGQSTITDTVKLEWKISGTALDEADDWTKPLNTVDATSARRNYDSLSNQDFWADFNDRKWEKSFRCSGNTRIDIPEGATVIMKDPFVAYYYPSPKGNIGYLRIPHYSPQNDVTGADETRLRFTQYEYAVSELEKNTVGLVIDQDHNCGGSVDYLHSVASLFIDHSIAPMQFRLLANKQEYLDLKGWADGTNHNTLEYQGVLKTMDSILKSWKAGDFMTPPLAINGIDLIHPHSTRYTKPIFMLIDELSGSGGDAFPALLQGNGRAKLIGTRTMGAGGHVTEQPALLYSQVKLRMTKSLFFRPDGVPVENNGAAPDFPYEITYDDFVFGYRNYRDFYTQKILELLPSSL